MSASPTTGGTRVSTAHGTQRFTTTNGHGMTARGGEATLPPSCSSGVGGGLGGTATGIHVGAMLHPTGTRMMDQSTPATPP